jgi:hypothetical protein
MGLSRRHYCCYYLGCVFREFVMFLPHLKVVAYFEFSSGNYKRDDSERKSAAYGLVPSQSRLPMWTIKREKRLLLHSCITTTILCASSLATVYTVD